MKIADLKLQNIDLFEVEDNIDDILFNIDVDTIVKVMEFVGWSWGDSDKIIPDATDIRKHIKNSLLELYQRLDKKLYPVDWINSKEQSIKLSQSSGGFEYRVEYYFMS
jgi:hypothetical protein